MRVRKTVLDGFLWGLERLQLWTFSFEGEVGKGEKMGKWVPWIEAKVRWVGGSFVGLQITPFQMVNVRP